MFSCTCMCLYFSGQLNFNVVPYIWWGLCHYFSTDVFSSPQLFFCSKKPQALNSILGQDVQRWQWIMRNELCMTLTFNTEVHIWVCLRERAKIQMGSYQTFLQHCGSWFDDYKKNPCPYLKSIKTKCNNSFLSCFYLWLMTWSFACRCPHLQKR